MELTYDWRGFQSMFYPRRRASVQQGPLPVGPIYLVVDGDVIVTAFGEREDLSEWSGGSFKEIARKAANRQLIAFERSDVDAWLTEGGTLPHFFDQVEFLRSKAFNSVKKPDNSKVSLKLTFQKHFLLEALCGWWNKVLPSSYGVYIRLEGQPEQDFLLVVRRGSFEGFHRPDLASLGADRIRQPGDIVKYLSERYLLPVQGLFVSAADWAEWSRETNPWRQVARAVSANRARLVPFRWGIALLMSVRAFFGF